MVVAGEAHSGGSEGREWPTGPCIQGTTHSYPDAALFDGVVWTANTGLTIEA